MKASTIGMWLVACAGVSTLAYASGKGADGAYLAHGPTASSEFEAGLHKLNPVYARGVWPSQEVLAGGMERDALPRQQRDVVNMYVKRVVANGYRPTPDGNVKGLRGIYEKEDAILLWKKIDDSLSVETTATTTVLTVTFKSAKLFNWSPKEVTRQLILNNLGILLAIPEEQLGKGEVNIAATDVAGTTIARGSVRIPSPEEAGEGLMGFRWYNRIHFWTSRGTLLVSVVPFEGAVAQPQEIKFGDVQD